MESAKITHQLQQQATQLTNAIEQQQLQAEIEAAHAKQPVIAQAIEEEEDGDSSSLLLSQSPSIIPAAPPQPITDTPRLPIKDSIQPRVLPPTPLASTNPFVQFTTPSQPTKPSSNVSHAAHQSPITISSYQQQPAFTPDDYAEAINLVRQRPSEPPMFSGDPLEDRIGRLLSMSHSIYQKAQLGKKWLKLRQFVDGRAYKAIQGFYRQKPETLYKAA